MSIDFNVYWFHFSSPLLAPLFALIGLLMLYLAFYMLKKHRYRKRHWMRTTGTVIDANLDIDVDITPFDREDPVDTRYTRELKIEFYTASGQRIQFGNPYSTSVSFQRLGKRMNIMYNPQRPQQAVIASGVNGAGCMITSIILMGLAFIAGGILGIIL
ncbi:DUF3592 domain-containing protein [Paenibacillus hunanensis]|uniref:DUF3592 domain-containing protein n=1 Tax=Paenibacillus hunanensis TaxID=539262 RepID=UPI002026279C|nr:DUF3592 domain-containing protein [Paenibacillus hunanensis]MCL9660248.1 DUF3592 domain-containing protein [Paenibacillus hunanensis]